MNKKAVIYFCLRCGKVDEAIKIGDQLAKKSKDDNEFSSFLNMLKSSFKTVILSFT